MDAFAVVSLTTSIAGWACLLLRLLPLWRTAGVFAVANLASTVDEVLRGRTGGAMFNAACCAFGAWQWWRGGGGGGTRRRLRAWRRAFRGVGVPRRLREVRRDRAS